jgi:hypothetical protein
MVLGVMALAAQPPLGAIAQAVPGTLSGTAGCSDGSSLANHTVRARDVTTAQVAATARTNEQGEFMFTGLPAGSYMVEVLSPSNDVIATSAVQTLTDTAGVAGIAVTAERACAGVLPPAAMTNGGDGFFTSTAGIVLLAAVASGVTVGVIAARGDSSPSR